MKPVMLAVLLVAAVAGCQPQTFLSSPPVRRERPTVNLPLSMRQKNWIGHQDQGSCVWASTVSLLRWQGRYRTADWVRRNYGGGEWPEDHVAKLDKAGIRYAYVTNGDVRFLEWSCRTRRGAGVTVMGGAHCVNLVFLDDRWACLLDNNDVQHYRWVPRETFLAEWRASHGWSFTVLYSPLPPPPVVIPSDDHAFRAPNKVMYAVWEGETADGVLQGIGPP